MNLWQFPQYLALMVRTWKEFGYSECRHFYKPRCPQSKTTNSFSSRYLSDISIDVNGHCINYKKKNWSIKRRFDLMPPGPIPRRVNVGFSPYVNYRVRFSNLGESHKISLRNKRQQQQSSHQLHMCTPIKKQPCWL